jgi:plasmid maintenance system antidote protein VapI
MKRAAKGKNKQSGTMSETLRRAIKESGVTLYRVAKDSGVSYPTLHRFANHGGGLAMAAADKLCKYFGLKLSR